MGLETASYISQLNSSNPTATDPVSEGDDHLRLVKGVLKTQFSGLTGTTAVTTSEAEMNILDGVTASTSELNIMDGVTATTSELNIMDGVTATTSEINIIDGVTATTAELNYTDGVTSNIQTQLDAKPDLSDAQTWTAGQRGEITALTSATTITIDMANSNNFSVTLAHNAEFANPSNDTAGQSGSIFITQDGTGSRTASWGSDWDFAGGTAPTLTTTAAAVDRIDYVIKDASNIHAVATLNLS